MREPSSRWSLCAAQMLENLPADPRRHLKIDVYSFGVTLWEMLSRQRPHSDIHPFQLQARAME